MIQSFKIVQQLVANFKANEAAYLASNYSESQVRQDFIDKFFTALGWDVTHSKQFNPYEQEVKIENRVTMPGTQRRADYAFFIMPNYRDVKFFTEAKKPSRNLSNADDYYQAIRYAWNANTPIAVLTDFEEFHILDCRYKPDIKDSLSRKLKQFHYSQYADEEKFKEIFFLFGREAVANGSLEKFAADLPKPRGKAIQGGLFKGGYKSVDEAFLEQLDEYRNTLAKAFKKENQELGGEELTEAVQRTIDRLVFIRFLEDKGIEEPQIIGLHENKSAWNSFLAICKRFEPKYNGLIFKPHRILDGNNFNPPDDRDFADICGELADPTSPYDFDKIPISILGSIYERFLGKVVHATDKRVKVEEKPEVRKAGGVYYTPEYIVRYIVKETVGKLIVGKTPEEIEKMSFADIACGSGSFLIEVYSELLEYHDRWYNANPARIEKDDVFERDSQLHLSLKKKKEILINNVYGVDIDFQATEVTQLSLYLKLLENVSMNETHQMGLFKETILPNLNGNIVCGNSLIGTDIGGLFESDETHKLKAMDYEDVFPKIMKRGGFDVVVGNPPYGAELSIAEQDYLSKYNLSTKKTKESYSAFVVKGIKLLKQSGRLSYIIPSAWTGAVDFIDFRKHLLKNRIAKIILLPFDIFKDAYIDTLLLFMNKNQEYANQKVKTYVYGKKEKLIDIELGENDFNLVDQILWIESNTNKFVFEEKSIKLIQKLYQQNQKLGDFIDMKRGVLLDKGIVEVKQISNNYYQYFTGDIYRYVVNIAFGGWVPFSDKLKERPKEIKWFVGERILLRRLVNRQRRMMANIVNSTFITNKNLYSILPKSNEVNLKIILGILNSKIISYLYLSQVTQATKDDFPQVTIKDVLTLPIPRINSIQQSGLIKLVEQLCEIRQKISIAKTDGEINRFELLSASLDHKIDDAVYEMYRLNEEEIKIVEGSL